MPFDYNEFSACVAKAREAKVSDEDILTHLATLDQGFKDARDNGYSLNEIDSFLKEKYKTNGSDINAYQTNKDLDGRSQDSHVQAEQAVAVQAGASEGVQDSLNIKTALTGKSQFGIGGEPIEKQEQMSAGQIHKEPQDQIQQVIPFQGDAGSVFILDTTFSIFVGIILLLAMSKFIARIQFSLSTSFWCSLIGHMASCIVALIIGFFFVNYENAAFFVVVAIEWCFLTFLFQIAVRAKGGTLHQGRAAVLALIVILGDLFVASPLIELWEHLH